LKLVDGKATKNPIRRSRMADTAGTLPWPTPPTVEVGVIREVVGGEKKLRDPLRIPLLFLVFFGGPFFLHVFGGLLFGFFS